MIKYAKFWSVSFNDFFFLQIGWGQLDESSDIIIIDMKWKYVSIPQVPKISDHCPARDQLKVGSFLFFAKRIYMRLFMCACNKFF